MKLIIPFLIFALIAVVVALFAWALAKSQNANLTPAHGREWFKRKASLLPLAFHRFRRQPVGGIQFANIGEGSFESGTKSYTPDAATSSRYLCYKIGTDGDHSAVCGAGDVPLGQSNDQADAGVPIAINLFGVKPGTLRVVTDGTIANGDHVKCGAAGVVVKASTTDVSFGIAIIGSDQSSASGDVITIMHCVPHKYVF